MTTRVGESERPGTSAHATFIARQPIFNKRGQCEAYELLFRDGIENLCPPGTDPCDAATRTAHSAWLTFGLPTLVGHKKAFVNMTRDLLVADYGHAFPAESVVIELLETIDGEAEVVEACRALKRKGYVLALDDFVYRPALDPLIPLADIIKIGFRDSDPTEQVQHVRRVATHGPTLLAEMVETRDEYTFANDRDTNEVTGPRVRNLPPDMASFKRRYWNATARRPAGPCRRSPGSGSSLSVLTLDGCQAVGKLRLAGLKRLLRQSEALEARWVHLVVLWHLDMPCANALGEDIGHVHDVAD